MEFSKFKNLGTISCIIAILTAIFDLSYAFNIAAIPAYLILSLISILINLFGTLIGFIGFLRNKHDRERLSYKMGIMLNLLVIIIKFCLPSLIQFFNIFTIIFSINSH